MAMFGSLVCLAVLLSGGSIVLFCNGCMISAGVKEDYCPDRFDIQNQKKATLSLIVSYIFLLSASITWGAAFFFLY